MICGAGGEREDESRSRSSDPGTKGELCEGVYGGLPDALRSIGCFVKLSEDGDTGGGLDPTGGEAP